MPRVKHTDRRVRWGNYIPESLAVEVEFLLPKDLASGRTRYGARNELVIKLLRRWVAEQKENLRAQNRASEDSAE